VIEVSRQPPNALSPWLRKHLSEVLALCVAVPWIVFFAKIIVSAIER
jgi:hypothetical protein